MYLGAVRVKGEKNVETSQPRSDEMDGLEDIKQRASKWQAASGMTELEYHLIRIDIPRLIRRLEAAEAVIALLYLNPYEYTYGADAIYATWQKEKL